MTKNVRDREGFLKIQLDLPPKSAERLLKFKNYMECGTYAEAVRHLLRMSDELISLRESGHEIVARSEDGSSFPVFIMIKP